MPTRTDHLRARSRRARLRIRSGPARIALAAMLTLVPVAVAHGAGQPPIAAPSGPISDELTTTYWAHPVAATAIGATAGPGGRRIAALHLRTEDGYPEVYEVLAQRVYPAGTWFRVRIPGRPNGRTGWVPETALGPLHLVRTHLVLDERARRLTLFASGRPIFSAPVGIGKPSTPTPRGDFWVREKFPAQGGVYGPYAFGTADYSVLSDWPRGGIIGIHGTNEPQLIPGDPSHGCIRLRNADITRLWPLLPVGTPLTIS